MFTGIIQDMGTVRKLARKGEDALLEVETALAIDDVRIGDSIAVSGACLTVTSLGKKSFTFDVAAESFSKTSLPAPSWCGLLSGPAWWISTKRY